MFSYASGTIRNPFHFSSHNFSINGGSILKCMRTDVRFKIKMKTSAYLYYIIRRPFLYSLLKIIFLVKCCPFLNVCERKLSAKHPI